MKKRIAILVLCLPSLGFAKVVSVTCPCSYYSDYLPQAPIQINGQDSRATDETLRDCRIVDPQGNAVAPGQSGRIADLLQCGFAYENAEFNCQERVSALTGGNPLERPAVQIDTARCFGSVQESR